MGLATLGSGFEDVNHDMSKSCFYVSRLMVIRICSLSRHGQVEEKSMMQRYRGMLGLLVRQTFPEALAAFVMLCSAVNFELPKHQ